MNTAATNAPGQNAAGQHTAGQYTAGQHTGGQHTGGRGTASPRVGMFPPPDLLDWDPATARAFLDQIAAAGIDHVCCGDHVSFVVGLGFDGLLQATAMATLHPSLRISCGLYLLPLRHPVLVARQLADIERLAPGRLTFGVGIGGEDRHEVAICGVDPATRGARMDECLTVLRSLLSGQAVTFHGRFFDLDDAVIAPPAPGIPIIVGGRSDAAIRRAGRFGDGWLGIWNSPRRFAAAIEMTAEEATRAGRPGPARHAMQVWCGLADSREAARACLAPVMEAFYQLPFERFERYCPSGTADDVAGFLAPYVAAGCTEFNLIPQSPDRDQAVAGVAAVRKLLARTRVASAGPHRVLPH
jgi:alkanesulfonate monooxygenase SsuD/methylene tetrahydromethanopterin reductase-like flavin-dependent oxidoreductase (luciferase family)